MKIHTLLTIVPIVSVALSASSQAATVTGWVSIFDPDSNNPRFVATTATTSSPVTTDADRDSIAANFTSTTLADGEFITLTGSVTFDTALAAGQNDQFRIGLFDGATVTQDAGGGYVGIYSAAPTNNAATPRSTPLRYGPGARTNGTDQPHPFDSGTLIAADILTSSSSVGVAAGTPISFSLMIARDGDNLDVSSSYTDGGAYNVSGSVDDLDILSIAPAYNYTFNTVSFLLGGSLDAGQASFSNIDVTTGTVPEPSVSLLAALGALAMLRRRRR